MDNATSILLNTQYGERRNVVLRLSLTSLYGADGLAYFANAVAERHEEAADALDFFVRLPAPGKITGMSEIRIDDVADLRSLKCVGLLPLRECQTMLCAPQPLAGRAYLCAAPPSPHPPLLFPAGNLTP